MEVLYSFVVLQQFCEAHLGTSLSQAAAVRRVSRHGKHTSLVASAIQVSFLLACAHMCGALSRAQLGCQTQQTWNKSPYPVLMASRWQTPCGALCGPSKLASGPSWARLDRLDGKRCAKDKQQMLLLLICQQCCSRFRASSTCSVEPATSDGFWGTDIPPQEMNTNMSCIVAAV